MGSVVFVHGTGVRQPAYAETFELIKRRLGEVAATAVAVPCYWADHHGARLHCDGASIPSYDETKGAAVAVVAGDDLALWAVLYEDPLAELAALAARGSSKERLAPGQQPFASRVPSLVMALPSIRDVRYAAGRCAPEPFLAEAAAALASEPGLLAAAVEAANSLARLGEGGYDLGREVVARAVVATTLCRAMMAGSPPCDATRRDEFVVSVFVALGGTLGETKGLLGDALRKAVSPVVAAGARIVTWRLRARRGAVTDAFSPVSGDILVYQANGEPIRRFIRKTIEDAPPPVHVLAHSLGGIACVDLCVLDPPPTIATLVTVGSQAPYLYELGALASLKPKAELPQAFPHWINVHDPNDMLSYIGNGVFPGRVDDVEVKSGLPFPYSHGAYWASDVLWTKLASRLT